MKLSDLSRYALTVCPLVSVLAACNSGGPQVTPLRSMQQRAAPFDMEKIQSTVVASVAHSAHRVSPDRIVYTPADVLIQDTQYSLDLNNDKTPDFVISESNTSKRITLGPCVGKYNYFGTLSLGGQGSNGVELSGNYAARLHSGSAIGPGQSFSTGSWTMESAFYYWTGQYHQCAKKPAQGSHGNWHAGKSGYLGLAFVTRGKLHYGWAKISVSSPKTGWLSATLTGYAYQTRAGQSIKAGEM